MSEWISVEDRLPEIDQIFIAYTKTQGVVTASRPAWLAEYKKTVCMVNCSDRQYTHWMPLPEPPKEGVDHE